MSDIIDQCGQALDAGGEVGLVNSVFSLIPPRNRYGIEFGARGQGPTWPLRQQHGWQTLLMDSGPDIHPPIHKECVTRENVNELFQRYQVPHEYDFLCIDIDGNDYWVWKAIDEARFYATVVCIEYNCHFPADVAVSVKYNPKSIYRNNRYYGASASAMERLARIKGYSLICVEGFMNLWFARDDRLPVSVRHRPLEDMFHYPLDVAALARQHGLPLPSWFQAPPPDLNAEQWQLV